MASIEHIRRLLQLRTGRIQVSHADVETISLVFRLGYNCIISFQKAIYAMITHPLW